MADELTRTCPECGQEFEGAQAPMLLGSHRRREHNVQGSSPQSKRGGKRKRADRAPSGGGTRQRQPSLRSDLARTFKVLGTVVGVVDPYCGAVLIQHSGPFCDALARLAAEDPRVGRWLRALGKAGPYGALVVAAGELAVPIAAHHGLMAPELAVLVGAEPPPERQRDHGRHEAPGLFAPDERATVQDALAHQRGEREDQARRTDEAPAAADGEPPPRAPEAAPVAL